MTDYDRALALRERYPALADFEEALRREGIEYRKVPRTARWSDDGGSEARHYVGIEVRMPNGWERVGEEFETFRTSG